MSSRGSPDLRLPLLATPRDSDPFQQARTGSGGYRDNDSTVGADLLQQDGSTHAPWTPNDSPRSTQVRPPQPGTARLGDDDADLPHGACLRPIPSASLLRGRTLCSHVAVLRWHGC